LYECHVDLEARLVDFAGWEMPVQYVGVIEEHRAVRKAAGLFDVSHMGQVVVRGSGATAFVQHLTPNDVTRLVPGRAHYSGLLTPQGTYIDDILVYRLGAEELLLVVNAGCADKDWAWIRTQAQDFPDIELEDVSERYALIALQGPRAVEILSALTSTDVSTVRYYSFVQGLVHVQGRKAEALLSRTGYTGEDGFELYVAPEDAPDVWRALLAQGESVGLMPAGLGARNTLRLEAGMALYGHELDEGTTPWEAGLSWVVKLDQGDFIGREALVAQKERGAERILTGFEVLDRGIAREGHEIFLGNEKVGVVTSGTWSPTFEKALGMAFLAPSAAEPGTDLEVKVRGRSLKIQVREIPFYRRPK
jgi:aminomethyltransferase